MNTDKVNEMWAGYIEKINELHRKMIESVMNKQCPPKEYVLELAKVEDDFKKFRNCVFSVL